MMNATLNAVEICLLIVSFIIMGILWYKISDIIGSKGYSTSLGTNPGEIFDFIKMIRKEENKRSKKDYIVILIVTLFFTILSFGLCIIVFLHYFNHPPIE
jgi:hypothetical protein